MPTRRDILRSAARALVGGPALATAQCDADPSESLPAPEIVRVAGTAASEVRLGSVGDTMLGDAAADRIAQFGLDALFEHLQSLVHEPTALMGNLEAPITRVTRPAYPDKHYSYAQAPEVAACLARQGFTALALANNHVLDSGVEGLADTLEHLGAAGLASMGAGLDEAEARRGVVLDFAGGPKVGLLSYLGPTAEYDEMQWFAAGDLPGCARARAVDFRSDIARLRTHADVVIVHLHFGTNYADVTTEQEALARAAIDAGADAVNGHHPHVAQAVEIRDGRPILYSLGNFVFGTPGQFRELGMPALGLWVVYEIDAGGIARLEIRGLDVDNASVDFQPRPIDDARLVDELLPILNARDAGFTIEGSTAVLALR